MGEVDENTMNIFIMKYLKDAYYFKLKTRRDLKLVDEQIPPNHLNNETIVSAWFKMYTMSENSKRSCYYG
ncbi:hypothetical protein SAMN05216352_105102 [Alteribacillus bidgolensis]|uniref:Uncharacterized protein n=1 Tax=Alteribacillus bidgolensis TaxID=930129 RepID=A0A1G8IAA1_9BACI|nr:hypothetical protein SAMN05216352_105102 [Alteribacillus bidgolensis]